MSLFDDEDDKAKEEEVNPSAQQDNPPPFAVPGSSAKDPALAESKEETSPPPDLVTAPPESTPPVTPPPAQAPPATAIPANLVPAQLQTPQPQLENTPNDMARQIADNCDFQTIIQAAELRAGNDKVKRILAVARTNFEALVEKLGQTEAEELIADIYLEEVEGKLLAAQTAQQMAES